MPEDYICGIHAVLAALTHQPERVVEVWLSAARTDRRIESVRQTLATADVAVHTVAAAKLDQLVGGDRHQGVVARVRGPSARTESDLKRLLAGLPPTPLLLVLDGVQDPHNLGACLRSADAAGGHGVILPRDQSAPLTAAARRAASGAAESIPVFQVVNLARALRDLKAANIWTVGATQDAETEVFDADLTGPLALVLGGEGKGLRRLTREHCDRLVRIPMSGTVESLNVSVAAGICLFEAYRQRLHSSRNRPPR